MRYCAECARVLRPLADYELEPALDRRMQDLGDRKEFLSPDEQAELLDLVSFARWRSIEKLAASVALRRLRETAPEVVSGEKASRGALLRQSEV